MNRYFYTAVLALALVTAYAVSQTGSSPSSKPPSSPPQSGTMNPPDASQSTSPSSNNPSSKDQSSTGQSMPQSDQAAATTDDQTLHTKVHEQLATNPAFSNVNVTVNNGVVTLEGTVASKQDRKAAEKSAESVPGVKKVKDKLKVESSSVPPASTFSSSHQTSSTMTSQSTTSSGDSPGTTPSGASSSGQTGTGSSGMPQSDTNAPATDNRALQDQIQAALKNEPTLANDAIVVTVTDNAVDLSGTAASKKERQTAERIAQSYAKNRKVTDHITVSGPGNSATTPPDSKPPDSTTNPENKNDTNPKSPSSQSPPDQSYPK